MNMLFNVHLVCVRVRMMCDVPGLYSCAQGRWTWEPMQNLAEFGAAEMVIDYEMQAAQGKHSVKYVNMNKTERAVQHLMTKHGLGGTIEQHSRTYE